MVEKISEPMAIEIDSPRCPALIFVTRYGRLLAILCGVGMLAGAAGLYGSGAGPVVSFIFCAFALPVWFLLHCFSEISALLVDTLVPK